MKRNLLFILILLLCVVNVQAQSNKVSFGLVSSFDWNSFIFSDYEFAHGRPGFSAGPFMRVRLSEKTSFDLGVNYATKSEREELSYESFGSPDDPLLHDDNSYTNIYRHGYLDIPLELNGTFSQKRRCSFYGSGGFVTSVLVHHRTTIDPDLQSPGNDYNEARYKNTLFAAKAGIGVSFNLGTVALSMEPQMRYYVSPKMESVHFGFEVAVLKL